MLALSEDLQVAVACLLVTSAELPAFVPAPSLPHPEALLRETGWETLGSAIGQDSRWLPYVLRTLLHPDPVVQSGALDDLEPIRHQSTVYPATVPAAMYIAAIISDQRTASMCMFGWYPGRKEHPAPLRSELISWLGHLASDADWAGAVETFVVQTMRPTFFNAIAPFLHDDDPTTRCAAIHAATVLVQAPELIDQRDAVDVLARSLDAPPAGSPGRCWRCVGPGQSAEAVDSPVRDAPDHVLNIRPSADTLRRAASVWATSDPWAQRQIHGLSGDEVASGT